MALYVDGDSIEVQAIIDDVTIKISRRFAGFIESDDVAQECWLWWCSDNSSRRAVDKLIEQGKTKLAAWKTSKEMSRHCERIARMNKAAWSGYTTADEQFYTKKAIIGALPSIIAEDPALGAVSDGGTTKRKPGEIVGKTDPAEGGGWLAVYVDVKAAWETARLTARERQVLVTLYGLDHTQGETADILGMTQQGVSKAAQRGLEKLSEALGGATPWDTADPVDEALRKRPGVRSGWSGMEQEVGS